MKHIKSATVKCRICNRKDVIAIVTDKQSRRFQLTINNPVPDFTHDKIKEILATKFKSFSYAAMVDEIGIKEQTPHTHIYVSFTNGVRFSTIKKHFPTAHIESARGSVKQNLEYLQKTGKWLETEKSETTIAGTFEELGERPRENKGKRGDLEELYHMIVEEELSNTDIIRYNNDYILQIDKLDKLRTMYLQEKFKGTRRLDLEVVYVYGLTGAGKTRDIYAEHSDENVYRVTDYKHPFDGYTTESVLVFEEYRNSLPLKDMLNYLDIYPIQLCARYANKYACYTKVYICTNWKLEKQYEYEQKEDSESYNALLRRIHKVKEYTAQGIIEYPDVSTYFNRTNSFVPTNELSIPEQEKIKELFPF